MFSRSIFRRVHHAIKRIVNMKVNSCKLKTPTPVCNENVKYDRKLG